MKKLVVDLAYDIINILKDEKYKIASSRIAYMHNLIESCRLIEVKHIVDDRVTLLDKEQNYYCSIEVLSIPQVIDVPLVCLNNTIIEISPIMILDICELQELSWSVVHEMCHLLSIGQYTYLDDCIHHCFGINEYQYSKSDMILIKSNENNCINELITDYVVWRLLETLYGHKIEPIYEGVKKFSEYLENRYKEDSNQECFIGWYFSGEVSKIKRILFDVNYKSYDDILEFLLKN